MVYLCITLIRIIRVFQGFVFGFKFNIYQKYYFGHSLSAF